MQSQLKRSIIAIATETEIHGIISIKTTLPKIIAGMAVVTEVKRVTMKPRKVEAKMEIILISISLVCGAFVEIIMGDWCDFSDNL